MDYMILSPIIIGNKIMKNRIAMAPMECRLNTIDGSPTQRMIDYYEARAKGGVGMVIVENTFVDCNASRSSVASSGLYSDHQIPAKAYLAEAIKDHGALAILQLSHAGRQASAEASCLECVAPSPIPCKVTKRTPRELSIVEIRDIEDAFAEAALRAKKTGFDGVEIHGAHGYLICEFLSPYTNKRTDLYGGPFENRTRMPKELIMKVREKVGRDFIVGFRLSVDEFLGSEGLRPSESCWFIGEVQDEIDYVHCSAGNYETGPFAITNSTYEPQAKLVPLAAEMKKYVSIPVIAVGSLDAELGEKTLREGSADIIAFGRQLIADPGFANKIYEGRLKDIRPCCRANEGCTSGFDIGYPMRCELNPAVGREEKYKICKTDSPKNIIVIGGGCAGLEAARVASLMGHSVVLLEKTERLGGHLVEAAVPPFKEKTKEMLRWLISQVEKSCICIRLNADTSPEKILAESPDAVFVAVGSQYAVPPIVGIENAIYADEALLHQERVGQRAVVIGGGLAGVETAMTLAENKKCDVTVIEILPELAPKMNANARTAVLARLKSDHINILCLTTIKEIKKNSVVCQDKKGCLFLQEADTVVIAAGLIENLEEADRYSHLSMKTLRIGDCVQARSIFSCFHEAWHAVFQINK